MNIDSSRAGILRSAARRVVRAALASGVTVGAALLSGVTWAQPVGAGQPEQPDAELSSTQPGTAKAFYEADLGAKVSGYVSDLLVDIGDRVTQGQVLARIAVPELAQAHNAAIADVEALQSEYDRVAVLVQRESVTEKALTEAKNRLDAATAHRDEIEAQMDYATIEAPFDGVVTWRAIDPGDMVYEASSPKGGSEPLLRVAKLDVIRVETYLPEQAAALVAIGDPATITFAALPGEPYTGKVSRMAGALDPATRTMLVEIDLPNSDGRIRPGYYGQTRIVFESRRQSVDARRITE